MGKEEAKWRANPSFTEQPISICVNMYRVSGQLKVDRDRRFEPELTPMEQSWDAVML
jgi:hypothetical protein